MDINVFSARELETVFRVLRTTLSGVDALTERHRRFLKTYAGITGYPLTSIDPLPIDPAEVRLEGAHQSKRLIQLTAVAALFNRPVSAFSVAYVKALARELKVRESAIGVLEAVLAGRKVRARMLAARRGMKLMLREAYRAQGWKGIARFLGAMFFKLPVTRDYNIRFKRLGLLPEGTLGREYFKFMAREGFNFPGEVGAIPAFLAYHDVGHVLAGHEATPVGEIQQGSFQGGSSREDGFTFVQFVILHFHHGIQVSPATPGCLDLFEPEQVLWAIHRGASMNVDITRGWDFWPLMALPVEEARRLCGLFPKFEAALSRAA